MIPGLLTEQWLVGCLCRAGCLSFAILPSTTVRVNGMLLSRQRQLQDASPGQLSMPRYLPPTAGFCLSLTQNSNRGI